jgi:Tetratricopeptide repeat
MEANFKENGLYKVWIAYSLANLAEISRKRGRGDDADRYFKRSLEVMAEAKLDNSSVSETMENYAKLLRQTGRARDGERMEIEAKARRTRLGKE